VVQGVQASAGDIRRRWWGLSREGEEGVRCSRSAALQLGFPDLRERKGDTLKSRVSLVVEQQGDGVMSHERGVEP